MPSTSKKIKKNSTKLSSGRPPASRATTSRTLSSKATRTLIRSHHQLHKALAEAEHVGESAKAQALRAQIESQGGLETYQQASLQGQARDRGGDTSKLMVEWIEADLFACSKPVRVLEVGALSTSNACSRHPKLMVKRIDLNSQSAGIEQQDFMERPLPVSEDDRFDILSLSLVLNYVPTASGRGEMLRRTCKFLSTSTGDHTASGSTTSPLLFLVLPAPCLTNSRYMDEDRFNHIMTSLGYALSKRKLTSKLIYHLWTYDRRNASTTEILKTEVNPGKTRNNFCVVLD